MENIKIYDAEYRFLNILWDRGSIKSTELVKIAYEELGWKKSTTFTVIRRLCERKAIKNEATFVTVLVKREQVMRAETEEHIDKVYAGSLKLFFTTFLQKEKMGPDEIAELKKIVEEHAGQEE
jgi:BlaI family penicillinase repressor